MVQMRESEAAAKQVLEAVFPGAEMHFQEKQDNGECDFDLCYADGAKAAVEATSITDGDWRRTVANLHGKEKGKSVVEAKKCTKSWLIFLTVNARVPQIRERIDDLLSEIEKTWPDSVEQWNLSDLRREYFDNSIPGLPSNPRWGQSQLDAARRILETIGKLGISNGAVWNGCPPPPQIFLEGPEGGGAIGATTVTSAAEAEAQKEDNRKKLGATGTQERHLAVWVDASSQDVRLVLSEPETFPPPDACPKLPSEITHLWVIAPVEHKGFIVWYGSKTQKWRSVLVSDCNRNVAE